MQNLLKTTKGFTLIELIVVIALTALIGTMGIYSLNSKDRVRSIFRAQVAEIVAQIRSARNLAISNQLVTINGVETVAEGGFGIHIDKPNKTLTLFVDSHNAAGDLEPNSEFDPSHDLRLPRYPAIKITDDRLWIEQLRADNVDLKADETEAVLIFKPPHAAVILNKNDLLESFSDLEIELSSTVESQTIALNEISKYVEIKSQ
jgi:prepilin-type N-terminal cleavage/methylation domain-containing protein